MLKTKPSHSVSQFLTWWVQGLAVPFPARSIERCVVKPSESGEGLSLTRNGQAAVLSRDEVARLARDPRRKTYLAVPDNAIISIGIPSSKRNARLDDVVAELIPFELNELWYGASADGLTIDAVLRQELAAPIKACQELGMSISGVVFVVGDEQRFVELAGFADFNSVTDVDKQIGAVAIQPNARWLILSGLLLLGAVAAASYWWVQESHLQAKLQQQLAEFEQFDADNSTHNSMAVFGALLSQGDAMSVTDSIRYLDALSAALPTDAVADQAILNSQTLLLDMRARSASLVRASADTSQLIASSEFVSAISTDKVRDMERFRLKLRLAEQTQSLDARELPNE